MIIEMFSLLCLLNQALTDQTINSGFDNNGKTKISPDLRMEANHILGDVNTPEEYHFREGFESPNLMDSYKIVVEDLILSLICSDKPSLYRRWRITNPNNFNVNVVYEVYGSIRLGILIATPGDTYFNTSAVDGPFFVKIYWKDENDVYRTIVKEPGDELCNETLTFTTSEGECQISTRDLPGDLARIIDHAPASYANFYNKHESYVVAVLVGQRTDGKPGAWEIHNDCTIKPLREGARKNDSELPNTSNSGLKYEHGWRFEITKIAKNGCKVFANAVNTNGFLLNNDHCVAAGAPNVKAGTVVPVSWDFPIFPYNGRIKGAFFNYECKVTKYNCSNGYVSGCNDFSRSQTLSNAEIKVAGPRLNNLVVYPNPVTEVVNINMELEMEDQVEIHLTDLVGSKTILGTYKVLQGRNMLNIDLDRFNIKSGLYILQLNGRASEYPLVKILKSK